VKPQPPTPALGTEIAIGSSLPGSEVDGFYRNSHRGGMDATGKEKKQGSIVRKDEKKGRLETLL